MTDKVQKIREEVERRYECWKEKESNSHSIESEIRMSECQHLLLMLDSLQKEPVSEYFEEAANNALNNVLNTHEIVNIRSCLEMFKYGAQWKEKEMQSTIELAEDHAMLAGMEKMKEQMMKDAIDVEVKVDAGGYPYIDKTIELYDYDKDIPLAKNGDKYKVVLIKEDNYE